jgi:HAD superfamily hydrolase (TIGR01490 family)
MRGGVVDTLALFDLDHTLIPFDSGMAWTQFLVERGVLSAEAEAQYLAYCHQYVAGTLDIHAMHRASLRPLLQYPRATLLAWQQEFASAMTPRVPPPMLALVRRHQDAGHLCAIVTATTEMVAEPFARLFAVDHLLATKAATVDGAAQAPFTGEIDGEPCFRDFKLTHVNRWLAAQPSPSASCLAAFVQSWFYSDSISDLPLLSAVSHPVAVRPDARLRDHACAKGWTVLDPT